jgi:hypothetical protein
MFTQIYSIVMAPLLRAFFIMLGSTTGVWVRFEKVRGNFFEYKAYLDGLQMDLTEHVRCSVKTCTIEFSILDFSLDTLIISKAYLEGARFEYHHVPNQDLIPRTLPPFLIRNLQIKDSEVVFSDHSSGKGTSLTLHLEQYHCEALHSQHLLFNALFSADMQGSIAQAPFSIQYREEGEKCISQCLVKGLPMKMVAPFVGRKLDLIEKSAMNVSVTNEWQVEADEITMTVQVLVIDLLKFDLPSLLPTSTTRFADALNIFINHQVKEIPLAFQFKLRKDDFMNLKDIDTVGILTAFADALTQAIMEKSTQNSNQLWDVGKLGLGTLLDLKKLFDKY